MQENTKQVIVKMTARRCFRTEPIYQYDVGHELVFDGFDLPGAFEVHFSLSPMGKSITQIGTDGVCTVPDMYAQTAAPIYAWLYIADTDTGLTKYSIEIPVQRRAKPTDQQPTPVQQSAIDQAIAALNAGVEAAEDAQEAAEAAQASAESYAESAGQSAITATNAATSAAASAGNAAASATSAGTSATDANASRQAADLSATNAGVSERNAAASATAAAGSATSAAASASQASGSAAAASGSASTASTKASEAAQSATAAAGSAASASEDAGTASTAATAAEASATAAAGSATAAAGSATSAGQSATAAAGSAAAAQEVLESIPEDYSDLSDDVDSLKSAINDIDSVLYAEGNILDLSQYAANNNTQVTNNGDGTFTFGTTDYGSTVWATKTEIPAGTYKLFAMPEAGYSHGYTFVSTTNNYNNRFVSNDTGSEITFVNTESRILYIGIRLTSRPSEIFTVTPVLIIEQEKKLDINQGSENAGKILGIDGSGNVTPVDAVDIDRTLQVSGDAADAQATGRGFDRVNNNMVMAPNMFKDPLFEDVDNAEKYAYSKITSKSITNNAMTCVTLGQNAESIDINVIDTLSTDIIYFNIKLSVSGLSGNSAAVQYGSATQKAISADGAVYYSGYTYGGENKKLRISSNGNNSKTIVIYCPIAINMTALFGANSIPALTDFEAVFNNFNRDLIGKQFSLQKYDYLVSGNRVMAMNLAVTNPLDRYGAYITKYTGTQTDVTGDGSASHINTQTISVQGNEAAGDVIYAAMWLKVGDANCTRLVLEKHSESTDHSQYTMDEIETPTEDTWYRLSGIRVTGATTGLTRFIKGMAVYSDDATQSGKTLSYKYGIVLNLTNVFGAGHEPMNPAIIDAMLSRYNNQWFMGTQDIWDNGYAIGMLGKMREFSGGENYGISDGRFTAKAVINSSLPDWNYGQFNYGLNKFVVPVNNKFIGGIETNGMVSVFPKYGRWEKGAADNTGEGGSIFGGHVFEAWNNIGSYRLTMMMAHGGDEREDEACIITYCPGTFESPLVPLTPEQEANRITREPIDAYGGGTMAYMQGRVRIGSDRAGEGVVFRAKSMKCYGSVCLNGSRGKVNGATNSGTKGDICFDDDYLYICVDDNTWKRIPLSW